MTEYIDKTKLIAEGWVMSRIYQQDAHTTMYESKKIADIPSEDVAPVVHGKWKLLKNGDGICSECHYTSRDVWDMDRWQNFCGHCGAKMDKE